MTPTCIWLSGVQDITPIHSIRKGECILPIKRTLLIDWLIDWYVHKPFEPRCAYCNLFSRTHSGFHYISIFRRIVKTGGAFCALKMPIDVCSHELPLISAFPVLDHDMNFFHSRYNGFSANKVFNLRDGHLKICFQCWLCSFLVYIQLSC